MYFKASDNSLNRVHEAKRELYESNSKLSKLIRLKPKTYNKLQIYLSQVGVNYLLKRVVDPVEYEFVNVLLAFAFGTLGYCFLV